jgi:glycogen debranching enzyme
MSRRPTLKEAFQVPATLRDREECSLPDPAWTEPAPRGCIARAWSVAEVLRAWVEDLQPAVAPAKAKPKKAVKAPF